MRFSSRTINFIAVGKPDSETYALYTRFKKLIESYCPVGETFIKESKSKDERKRSVEEARRILSCASKSDLVVVLDEGGSEFDSRSFARWLGQALEKNRNIAFVIGSDIGLGSEVKERADLLLSLSKMTFSHRLALLVIAEQVYRALTILAGHPYHR